jgi:hypothetical protein
MGNMNKTRRRYWLGTVVGLSLTALAGCQTWVTEAGVTLPSGHYLEHPAQYVPASPPFPLSRELTSMEAGGIVAGAAAGAGGPAVGAPAIAPAPAPPAPVPPVP